MRATNQFIFNFYLPIKRQRTMHLGENTIGLAAYGGGDSTNAKHQSIYAPLLLLAVIATYQFISLQQIS
jgi:hypothetical protein